MALLTLELGFSQNIYLLLISDIVQFVSSFWLRDRLLFEVNVTKHVMNEVIGDMAAFSKVTDILKLGITLLLNFYCLLLLMMLGVRILVLCRM